MALSDPEDLKGHSTVRPAPRSWERQPSPQGEVRVFSGGEVRERAVERRQRWERPGEAVWPEEMPRGRG